MNLHSI